MCLSYVPNVRGERKIEENEATLLRNNCLSPHRSKKTVRNQPFQLLALTLFGTFKHRVIFNLEKLIGSQRFKNALSARGRTCRLAWLDKTFFEPLGKEKLQAVK
jgi:hypothetical protein